MPRKLPKDNLKNISGAKGNIEGTHPTPGKRPKKVPIAPIGGDSSFGRSIPHGTGPEEKI